MRKFVSNSTTPSPVYLRCSSALINVFKIINSKIYKYTLPNRSKMLSLLLLLQSFSHQYLIMVFHRSLSDNKSPQVSSILADLDNAVVLKISTSPLIFKFSSLFINPFVTVPRAPITIGINVTFMLHSFFNSLAMS